MSPRRLGALQEALLDSVKAAHPGTTDAAIADAAGVDRSQVSKWRHGEREMRLGELADLLRPFGAVAVLSPIAALDAADVVERQAPAKADPRQLVLEVNLATAQLTSRVHQWMADGRLDAAELAEMAVAVESLVLDLRRLQAGARSA